MTRRMILGTALSAVMMMGAKAPTEEMNKMLHGAIRAGDNARIRMALDGGADPDSKDAEGTPALMNAALYGSAATMKMLLDKGASADTRNAMDATALIWSAANPEKAKLLVARGADVNAQSKLGRTPLLVAASASRNAATVKLLLDKGAKTEVRDNISPIPVVPVGGGKGTALIEAARSGDLESVKLLLKAGADVKATTVHGASALSEAVMAGRVDVVRYLLDQGAPADIEVTARKFPMMALAKARGNAEVIAMLRAKGVKDAPWDANDPAANAPLTGEAMPNDVPLGEALARAVGMMRKSAPESFKKTGCASCHHTTLPVVAATAARKVAPLGNLEPEQGMVKMALAMFKPMTPLMLEGSDVPPDLQVTAAYFLEALQAAGYESDTFTTSMAHKVAQSQLADGHWTGWAPRPPLEHGDIQATAHAIRTLTIYAIPGRKAEIDERVARARKWLLTAVPKSTEDYTARLLGLHWSGAAPSEIDKAAKDLASLQRGNGGWAQESYLEPDAYATGKALVALSQTGGARGADTEAAVKFLRQTQRADGTWMVRTRAIPFQPLIDTGFPHGRNQWISAAATAWAVQALALHAD